MDEELKKESPSLTPQDNWDEQIRFTLWVIIAALFIRFFIAQPFVVSGSSMVPTFQNKDYLIIDEVSYILGQPKRFDVAVFRYPKDPKKYFIKRIIGLPNEKIKIVGSEITIINEENKNGFILEQPYVKNPSNDNIYYELKNDEYYMIGDNRPWSSDSRVWGPVQKKFLIGRT
ncbi:MAG: signal peptidase I, partial [Patescibacteria group bacterium]